MSATSCVKTTTSQGLKIQRGGEYCNGIFWSAASNGENSVKRIRATQPALCQAQPFLCFEALIMSH